MPNSVAAEISRDDEGVTTVTFTDTPPDDVFKATWDWAQKGTDPFIFVICGVRYLVQPAKPISPLNPSSPFRTPAPNQWLGRQTIIGVRPVDGQGSFSDER